MSWINSNATYKQNSKNDLSFYHGFSKTPVEPTSTGTAATTLANASTKGGHTVIGTEVWAEEIPWFGLVPSRAVAVTRLSGLTKLNDLVKVDGEGGKVYKYIGADDAVFTEAQWASFWQEVTLTNGMTLNNRHNQPVLRYYLNQPMQTLTTTNNASIDSKGYATRLFVNESNHTGQTSGGSVVSQFAAGTDNIKNGIPSVELNPKLYLGTTEKIAGTHYYDYNVSGTILWSTAVTSSSPKISCFRYIGKTVTGQLSTVDETIKSHAIDISDIKATLGMESTNPDGTPSVTARVETVEDVVRVLLGLGDSDAIAATESISATANNAATSAISTALAEGGSIAEYIATNAKVSVNGQSATTITVAGTETTSSDLVHIKVTEDKTTTDKIGLTLTATLDAAVLNEDGSIKEDGVVIATIAKDIADSAITSAITTDNGAIKDAIDSAISGATLADGEKIATTTDTSKLVTVEDVTTYVSENAKVTLTQGTGITVTPNGEASTSFTVAVDDTVATKKSVDDLSDLVSGVSQTVAGIQTEISTGSVATGISEAKAAAKAAQDTADAKVASVSGPATGLVTVTGDKDVVITVSDTIATKTDAATAASTAIATSLAGTATDTIGGAITSAVSGLETKLTTGEGSLGAKVTALESSVKTINETTIPNAITAAQNGAVTTVKALSLSATDSDDASKVTVTLGGTVEKPTITVTSSDIASAQTLATLKSTVETHISEAAGLYLSVEKVDTLPADAAAKANKIYLVPVDTEAGRAQNIHTEYIWTNGQWEIIGTTAIDINSLEASAKAAQDAADKAQGEVDAVEEAIAAMDADLTVNGISVKQVDGKVTELSETLITASVPAGTTKVEGNVAYASSTKHVIAPEKFQTAAQMPTTLTSWVADLSNLTVGDNMFKGCTGLTVFIGDLSSLTSGVDMFNGCTLDAESLEILAENLPTVTSGTIDIGAQTNATAEVIATIKNKKWTVKSNGTAL